MKDMLAGPEPTPTVAEVMLNAICVATVMIGIAGLVVWVRSIPRSSN